MNAVKPRNVDPAFSVDARQAALLMIISAACYSGSVVVARGVHESIPPMALVFWRCTLSSLLLAPFVWRGLWKMWPLPRNNWGLMVAVAVTQSIAGQGLLYLGLQSTTATNAGLINTTLPFLAVLLAALFACERVSRLQVGGMVTAGIGVVAVIVKGDLSAIGEFGVEPGGIWIQLAMVSWGIYAILVRRMSAEFGILVAYLAMTMVGALIALPLFLSSIFYSAPSPHRHGRASVRSPTSRRLARSSLSCSGILGSRPLALGPPRTSYFCKRC